MTRAAGVQLSGILGVQTPALLVKSTLYVKKKIMTFHVKISILPCKIQSIFMNFVVFPMEETQF